MLFMFISKNNDIFSGFLSYRIWFTLGFHDIKQRYRRSVIGPFWFTLSTAFMVAVLGSLYSQILNHDINKYLPYLASGLTLWQFISTSINEGSSIYIDAGALIKQVKFFVKNLILSISTS